MRGVDRTKSVVCFMKGVIVPPFKLIVKTNSPPKGGLLLEGVYYEGGGRLYIYIYI